MKKGDKVIFIAIIESSYFSMPVAQLYAGTKHDPANESDFRAVYRAPLETPQQGVFIGWSKLLYGRGIPGTGRIRSDYDDYGPAGFETQGAVKVAVIAPLTGGESYRKSVRVLPEDLELNHENPA